MNTTSNCENNKKNTVHTLGNEPLILQTYLLVEKLARFFLDGVNELHLSC